MMGLPVTRERVVAFDNREARLVGAGDEVRDAVPSISGVTNGARAALGPVRRVATLNPGEARGIIGARRRRWQCWHYGITGITARVTSAFPFLSFFLFSFFFFFFSRRRVLGFSGDAFVSHAYSIERARCVPGKLRNDPACRTSHMVHVHCRECRILHAYYSYKGNDSKSTSQFTLPRFLKVWTMPGIDDRKVAQPPLSPLQLQTYVAMNESTSRFRNCKFKGLRKAISSKRRRRRKRRRKKKERKLTSFLHTE
jgi:hypothetical protein